MTDEDISKEALAKIHECFKRGGTVTVALPSSDEAERRADERMRENRDEQVKFNNERDEREFARRDAFVREETAATVLAALMQANATMSAANDGRTFIGRDELASYIKSAVEMADALREALKGKP